MKIDEKIKRKGYEIRVNTGNRNGMLSAVSYSAMKNGREYRTASSKTALFKKL